MPSPEAPAPRHLAPAVPLEPAADPLDDPSSIPVLEPLSGLLPEGLRRGDCVSIAARDRAPDSLTLALLAGALRAGLWCAVVGVPELGVAALAGLLGSAEGEPDGGGDASPANTAATAALTRVPGAFTGSTGAHSTADADAAVHAALNRLLLVPEPGERWAQVVAALAEAVDVLLVRPPAKVPADLVRRIEAKLRQGRGTGIGTGRGGTGVAQKHGRGPEFGHGHGLGHGHSLGHGSGTRYDAAAPDTRHRPALLVLGPWESARLVLRTAETRWMGLNGSGPTAGTGRLIGCRAVVVAEGRAVGGRPRTARLWLPAADGTARRLDQLPAAQYPEPGASGMEAAKPPPPSEPGQATPASGPAPSGDDATAADRARGQAPARTPGAPPGLIVAA